MLWFSSRPSRLSRWRFAIPVNACNALGRRFSSNAWKRGNDRFTKNRHRPIPISNKRRNPNYEFFFFFFFFSVCVCVCFGVNWNFSSLLDRTLNVVLFLVDLLFRRKLYLLSLLLLLLWSIVFWNLREKEINRKCLFFYERTPSFSVALRLRIRTHLSLVMMMVRRETLPGAIV